MAHLLLIFHCEQIVVRRATMFTVNMEHGHQLDAILQGRGIRHLETDQAQTQVSRVLNVPQSFICSLLQWFQDIGSVHRIPAQCRSGVRASQQDRYLTYLQDKSKDSSKTTVLRTCSHLRSMSFLANSVWLRAVSPLC